MVLKYNRFFVLANLIALVVFQSQFVQFSCELAKKNVSPRISFEEKMPYDPNSDKGEDFTSYSKGDTGAIRDSAKGLPEGKNASPGSSDGETDSELQFTDNYYELPTESSSNGRFTDISRGRSRERRYKYRHGEKRLDSDDESTSESSSDKEISYRGESKERPECIEKEGSSDLERAESFDEQEPESIQTHSPKESDSETESEEIGPLTPITQTEDCVKKTDRVDQVIQLLHNQANLEAITELERKKRLKKEKLENQEKMMDMLMSVIDSMQKNIPFDDDYIQKSVKNSAIDDLVNAQYLYQKEFEDATKKSEGDLLRNQQHFKQRELTNEIKTLSMAKYFYSKPNHALSSEIQAYTPLVGSTPKGGNSGPFLNKDQAVRPKVPKSDAVLPKKGTKSSETQTNPSSEKSPLVSIKPSLKSKGVRLSGKPVGGYEDEAGRSNSGGSSRGDSGEPGEPPAKEVPGLPKGARSPAQAPMRPKDGLRQESGGPSTSGEEEPKADEHGKEIDRLKLELIKFENRIVPDLKKSTALNNVGRIKAKSSYTLDDYTVKTSSKEDTFLTRGKAAVGRIKKSRDVGQSATHHPGSKPASKPIATVGRLKAPTRVRSIDQMRTIEEDKWRNYDFETAAGVLNIKSASLEGDDQVVMDKLAHQLRNPYSIPDFVPSDVPVPQRRETHFLGDKPPPRANQNAFRRGMMASASRINMANHPLIEGGQSIVSTKSKESDDI